MPLEKKGNQIRKRIREPDTFGDFIQLNGQSIIKFVTIDKNKNDGITLIMGKQKDCLVKQEELNNFFDEKNQCPLVPQAERYSQDIFNIKNNRIVRKTKKINNEIMELTYIYDNKDNALNKKNDIIDNGKKAIIIEDKGKFDIYIK